MQLVGLIKKNVIYFKINMTATVNFLEHNFSIQSPNLLIHLVKCWKGFCMLSDKKAFGQAMGQACTAYFTAWPLVH